MKTRILKLRYMESSVKPQSLPEYSYKPIFISLFLQVLAIALLKAGQGQIAGLCIAAIAILAVLYATLGANLLMAAALLLNSVGTAIIFRDNVLTIFYNTYPFSYILIAIYSVILGAQKSPKKLLPVVLAFGFFWLSGLWGEKPINYGMSVRLWGAVATMIVFYQAIRNPEDLEFLTISVILGALAFVPAIYMFQVAGERFGILAMEGREYGNPMAYMAHTAAWTIVGISIVVSSIRLNYRKLIVTGIVAMAGVMIWSTSRTNLAVLILGSSPIILRGIGRRTAMTLILVAAIITMGGVIIMENKEVYHYLVTKTDIAQKSETRSANQSDTPLSAYEMNKITSGRFDLIQNSFNLFLDNPIIGVGFGNSNVETKSSRSMVIHSFWVKLLAETGIMGFLMFLLILWSQFVTYFWKDNQVLPGLSLGLLIGMLAYGMAAHGLDLVMWGMYGTALAVTELNSDTLLSPKTVLTKAKYPGLCRRKRWIIA